MTLIDKAKKALEGATPGPWFVHDFSGAHDGRVSAPDVAVSCAHPDHITVCVMWGGYMRSEGYQQGLGDARLIALAPDLARALIAAKELAKHVSIKAGLEAATDKASERGDYEGAADLNYEAHEEWDRCLTALAHFRKAVEGKE